MKFLIKNANLVFKDCVKKKDLLTKENIIYEIKDNIQEKKEFNVIDAKGLFCMPGIVDLHVHLRDPGFLQKETVETGARAALKGGITSIACMANTNPVIDDEESLALLQKKTKKEKLHIYEIAAITKGLKGQKLTDFKKLASLNVAGFSDDGFFVRNSKLMKIAAQEAFFLNLPIFSHCEDLDLTDGGFLNEGKVSKKLNLKGIDNASEAVAVAREVALCLTYGFAIHICHVSTKQSIKLIRFAKQNGAKISAQTCPQYFMLTDEEVLEKDANFKMNPPLRSKEDVDEIVNAILDGTIDCIATDHAPHEEAAKKDFETAANGVIGLETLLSCVLTKLHHSKKMSLNKIADVLCKKPAEILRAKNCGEIAIGKEADLTIFDVNKEMVVSKEDFVSKSKNSPFLGKRLKGKVLHTFCSGEKVY